VISPGRGAARFRWPSPATWTAPLGALVALSTLALVPLTILGHQSNSGWGDSVIALVIGVPAAIVGVVVARHQPGNPLGWLLLAIAVCLILATDGSLYAFADYRLGRDLPAGLVAVLLGQLWGPGIYLLGLVILLFPDGRLPSAGWRRVLWAYLVLYAFSLVTLGVATAEAIIGHPVRVDSGGGLPAVDHPVGWYAAVDRASFILVAAFWLCFVVRQVASWRRSSGERRQQLKWLMSGAAVLLAGAVLAAVTSSSSSGLGPVLSGIGWFSLAALPVSMGVAILKYRLYEIDRLISRTLAYAVVTGLLVGVYAGVVAVAGAASFSSPVEVAAATLAAAALFSPLRRRVQRIVDRRFNRARYDADAAVAAFAARLQDAVDLDTVRADLASVVHDALEPAHMSVWVSKA
jgi:hypothetical protein